MVFIHRFHLTSEVHVHQASVGPVVCTAVCVGGDLYMAGAHLRHVTL